MMTNSFTPFIAKDRYIGPYQFDMHIEDENAKEWYDTNPNQWQRERQWCIDTIRPGFNVLDCGAHQGLTTLLFSYCVGSDGVVHAWEALPQNASLIERNAILNGRTNIVVHPYGVGSQSGLIPISENSGNSVIVGAGSIFPATGQIKVVRLDDDVSPDMRVDFLKIDVEGHELHALRGAERILSNRPFLMLELHHFLWSDAQGTATEIGRILNNLDYYVWIDDFEKATDIGKNVDAEWFTKSPHAQLYCAPA
ncbi:FkbM family methyltransferase [Roseomonas sp. NAR14]|uniref:FkbM family methyltransferase n=1 Tax=Roseomonas acroporae TaxID=2937791 RepID=A0A9X2BWB0_9PROT|nr:FkbM family methyltransferase [Roseomonas acroporae]MCK8785846.1 FkbM family methyltransferase [Roseomonas acroporae]